MGRKRLKSNKRSLIRGRRTLVSRRVELLRGKGSGPVE
jgi:hypothetical protein